MILRKFPLLAFLTGLVCFSQRPAEEAQKLAEQALQEGNYALCIEKGTEVLRTIGKAPNQKLEGAAENVIGAAFVNQGDYSTARPHLERAIALARDTGELRAEVRRSNNLGNVYFYLGQYVTAYDTYQSALRRLSGAQQESWYSGTLQLTLTNLAVLHQQLGQHQKALDLYREIRALPLQMKPNVEAQMLTNLAVVYRRLGDPQKALDTYRQARKLLAADPNAAAALFTLHNAGVVEALDFQNLPAALATFNEAIQIAQQHGSKRELTLERLFRGETLLRMHRAKEAQTDFTIALEAARSLNLRDELWTALYGLGRVQSAAGAHAAARESFEQAIQAIESDRSKLAKTTLKAEFLAEKRDVYDALIGELLDQPQPSPAEILRHMEEGRARNLKEQLSGEGAPVQLESIQRALDADMAVLAYWVAGPRLAVIWITHDRAGILQNKFSSGEEAQINSLEGALAHKDSDRWRNLADVASQTLRLDNLPLSPQMRKLVIIPDGPLQALPFEVLRAPSGRRLVESFAISYMPSAHFLTMPPKPRPRRWPWQVFLAAFADPVPATTKPFDTVWPRLPYSAQEAESIARVLPGRKRLFLGARDVKRELFDSGIGQTPVLHFATHASVDTDDSRRSRLVFSPVAGDASSQYLFSTEISKLSLNGVELVTLAACESELGRYVRGEGVENFARAFLSTGAASTLSSLWLVSDKASAQLMQNFYTNLAAGQSKSKALQQAKIAMLRSGGSQSHPYFWAPYLLSGEAQTPLSPTIPWWQPALILPGLILALVWRKFF